MKTNHMIGITPAHDAPRFDMLRDLGVQWVRQGYVFPFAERGSERPSDAFLRSEEQVETYLREGFQVLASFPGPGSMRYAPEAGKTVYVRAMPEWMGEVGSADYQKALFDAAQALQGRVGIRAVGKLHLIGKHRLQHRPLPVRLKAQAVAGAGASQAGDGAHSTRRGLIHGAELCPGVDPQLVRLLGPDPLLGQA